MPFLCLKNNEANNLLVKEAKAMHVPWMCFVWFSSCEMNSLSEDCTYSPEFVLVIIVSSVNWSLLYLVLRKVEIEPENENVFLFHLNVFFSLTSHFLIQNLSVSWTRCLSLLFNVFHYTLYFTSEKRTILLFSFHLSPS